MSFNISVRVTEGTPVVTASEGVPDGDYVIAGHEDDGRRDLSVTRRGSDGRYVQEAYAVHHKESA